MPVALLNSAARSTVLATVMQLHLPGVAYPTGCQYCLTTSHSRCHRYKILLERRRVCAAIGTRVKYLVDTPEAVWGLLDSGDVLAAAHRFVGAACVRRRLAAARNQRVLRRQFPLLSQEESTCEQKRGEILAKASAGAASATDADQARVPRILSSSAAVVTDLHCHLGLEIWRKACTPPAQAHL